MIEMRWVYHNLEHSGPPAGAICVDTDGRLFQKLQYRTFITTYDNSLSGMMPSIKRQEWSSWIDVPHTGLVHPNAEITGG